MAFLSSSTRASLIEKKAKLEELLEAAYDAFELNITSAKKSYKLDTAEGMQSTVKQSLKEQRETIEHLEAQIDRIDRRLRGALNVNLNVRRKQRGNMGGRRRW